MVVTTLVAGLALVAAGVPLFAAPGGALYRALGVLVAGSPCAVVLVPLAYVCAMAAVTRRVRWSGAGSPGGGGGREGRGRRRK